MPSWADTHTHTYRHVNQSKFKKAGVQGLWLHVPGLKIKIKLMLCKPLFIVHGKVKGLFKVILEYKNKVTQLKTWAWHMHNKIA